VYIDKVQTGETEEYVCTDDCEKVSRFLSAELDRLDPIEQNYYLEVSSPGMDRVLIADKHFERFAGHIVDINLYKAVDGRKAYQGELVGLVDGKIIIKDEKDNQIEFPKEQVSKTRLAVIF
jgi:ribosome maturation factor RimP